MLTFGFCVRIYIPRIFIFAVERLELIHDIIRKNPAVRFNDVMRLSKLKNGTLTHYISKLENMEKSVLREHLELHASMTNQFLKKRQKFVNNLHVQR